MNVATSVRGLTNFLAMAPRIILIVLEEFGFPLLPLLSSQRMGLE